VDRSRDSDVAHDLSADDKRLTVANKSDLAPAWSRDDVVAVSALTGAGLDVLRMKIAQALDVELVADRPAVTNIRHIALLERARTALMRAHQAAQCGGSTSEEFVLVDLQEARGAFEEITGHRAPEAVLRHIFERFCVGK
jgi:tRNA modification GTPase